MALNRRKEREIAFQMLFASQFYPDEETSALFDILAEESDEDGIKESEYIKKVFCGAREDSKEEIDLISKNAVDWKTERLSKATLAILELAIFEMNKCDDIPIKISINEAVELAKKYDSDKAPKFINGVLGSIAEQMENNV